MLPNFTNPYAKETRLLDIQELKRRGSIAREWIACEREVIALTTSAIETERSRLSLSLFRASAEHGLAIADLITRDPLGFGGTSYTLLRPQIEKYLRAVFFADPLATTDEEVVAFIATDALPPRLRSNGRTSQPTTKELAALVGDSLARIRYDVHGRSLVALLNNALHIMHGLVHGGGKLVKLYGSPGLACTFKDPQRAIDDLLRTAVNMVYTNRLLSQHFFVEPARMYEYSPEHAEAIITYAETYPIA